MMYRQTVHHLRDDHFLVFPIFPVRHPDFVDVKDQFCLHAMDILSKTADRFVQKALGISSLVSSCGELFISTKSSVCRKKKELTYPRLIGREQFISQ
jgi:hypothetical protein